MGDNILDMSNQSILVNKLALNQDCASANNVTLFGVLNHNRKVLMAVGFQVVVAVHEFVFGQVSDGR